MSLTEIPELEFYGNPLRTWFVAVVVLVATLAVLTVVRVIAARRLARLALRTHTSLDDLVVDLIRRTRFPFLLLLALAAASVVLVLPLNMVAAIRTLTVLG